MTTLKEAQMGDKEAELKARFEALGVSTLSLPEWIRQLGVAFLEYLLSLLESTAYKSAIARCRRIGG